MDFSFDFVAAKCADQMAAYQQCVQKNQNGDWATICRPEGRALTACADASVPHLAQVKEGCAGQISRYRACLEEHQRMSDDIVRDKCAAPLRELWECTEARVGELTREGKLGGDADKKTA